MTLVKNWTIYIIQDDSFNSSFAVNNHRKLIKIDICPKFKREGGGLKAGQMSRFRTSQSAQGGRVPVKYWSFV